MSAHPTKYLLAYAAPIAVWLSLYVAGLWSYFALVFVFVLIPALELFLPGTTENLDEAAEAHAKKDSLYDFILYSLVPIQFATMVYFLFQVSDPGFVLYEKTGMMIAFGLSCGVLGINAAHELGHRSNGYEQTMSKMLLSTSLYMHFFIEHNRGHHKNVATEEDPASSRYGENLYAFYIRSIWDGWFSAWKLESERLQKSKQGFWTYHNEMLRFQFIQVALVLAIAWIFGLQSMLFFLGSAIIGFLLLETVNYIEHYGLRRKSKDGKHYERTMPIHSWNSNHSLGRVLLLELTRHSDHHYLANRKYQILRHFDESPQMPTGYPGMMLLAFFPPLWFRVMHKQIEKYRATREGVDLA